MTRKDIERDYQVDRHGRIQSPGKFEGEMLYVPYFYELMMDGDGEYDDSETSVTAFDVNDEDRKEFPELEDVRIVRLHERGDGFVVEV